MGLDKRRLLWVTTGCVLLWLTTSCTAEVAQKADEIAAATKIASSVSIPNSCTSANKVLPPHAPATPSRRHGGNAVGRPAKVTTSLLQIAAAV